MRAIVPRPARGPALAALLGLCLVTALLASSARSGADVVQKGHTRVSFEGALTPHTLPRQGSAPVTVSVGAKIASTGGAALPQLRRMTIAINRDGVLDPGGLPVCRYDQVQPTTTADALSACRSSLVGEGRFSAEVLFAQQAPFPSAGKILAFNGVLGCAPEEQALDRDLFPRSNARARSRGGSPPASQIDSFAGGRHPSPAADLARYRRTPGREAEDVRRLMSAARGRRDAKCHPRPAILAHIYGTAPVPTSFTLPFLIGRSKGTFGTVLSASLPEVTGNSGRVTGLSLKLGRTFASHGETHGYVEAGCPAPKGFPGATFPFARASFAFAKGPTLSSTLVRSCGARG